MYKIANLKHFAADLQKRRAKKRVKERHNEILASLARTRKKSNGGNVAARSSVTSGPNVAEERCRSVEADGNKPSDIDNSAKKFPGISNSTQTDRANQGDELTTSRFANQDDEVDGFVPRE